jgi:hypothetical protein
MEGIRKNKFSTDIAKETGLHPALWKAKVAA